MSLRATRSGHHELEGYQIRPTWAWGWLDLASMVVGRWADDYDEQLQQRPSLLCTRLLLICVCFLWVLFLNVLGRWWFSVVNRSQGRHYSWMLITWDVIIVSLLFLVGDWFWGWRRGCAWYILISGTTQGCVQLILGVTQGMHRTGFFLFVEPYRCMFLNRHLLNRHLYDVP